MPGPINFARGVILPFAPSNNPQGPENDRSGACHAPRRGSAAARPTRTLIEGATADESARNIRDAVAAIHEEISGRNGTCDLAYDVRGTIRIRLVAYENGTAHPFDVEVDTSGLIEGDPSQETPRHRARRIAIGNEYQRRLSELRFAGDPGGNQIASPQPLNDDGSHNAVSIFELRVEPHEPPPPPPSVNLSQISELR